MRFISGLKMQIRQFLAARLAIVFALMLAMAGSGFAHQFTPADTDESLAAYLAAGGSYADICADFSGGHPGSESCDACRLVDSASVPAAVPAILELALTASVISPTLSPSHHAFAFSNPAHPPRAPPLV